MDSDGFKKLLAQYDFVMNYLILHSQLALMKMICHRLNNYIDGCRKMHFECNLAILSEQK